VYRLLTIGVIAAALVAPAHGLAAEPGSYGVAIVSASPGNAVQRVHITYGAELAPRTAIASPQRVEAAPSNVVTALDPVHARIGDKRPFVARWFGETNDGHRVLSQFSATLQRTTAHADIWFDDSIPADFVNAFGDAMARAAENGYLTVAANFGNLTYTADNVAAHLLVQACDRGGRPIGKVPAFVRSRGELVSILVVTSDKARVGYADNSSFHYAAEMNCNASQSNEIPALFVWPRLTGNWSDAQLRDGFLVNTLSHETQHLANFVRHQIRSRDSRVQAPFIDESLSNLSQDFAVQRLFGKPYDLFGAASIAEEYLRNPNTYGFLGFNVRGMAHCPCYARPVYGGAYLFERYLYDTFGTDYLTRVTDTDDVGIRAVERATGLPMSAVMDRFATALLSPRSDPATVRLCSPVFDMFGRLDAFTGVRLTPLDSEDIDVMESGVSFFISSRPIQSISARGAPLTLVQVPYKATVPPGTATSCVMEVRE
jgi:hypothetical protein